MKPLILAMMCAAALALAGCADMGVTSAGLTIRSAPPPPQMSFDSDPHFGYLSDLRVYVISDDSFGYDMFRFGGYYYVYSAGYWYRSDAPRGTWVAIEERRVPRQIFEVDDQRYHWRNHPQNWRGGQHTDRGQHRGNGNGNGNGNSNVDGGGNR